MITTPRLLKDLQKVYFKNAQIVIDRFHFIRQVFWAFYKVRHKKQHKFSGPRRRYFKRSKKLLWTRFNNLDKEGKQAVEVMLNISPKLQEAYLLKEKFMEFVDSESFEEAKKKLLAWYLYVLVSQLPEFDYCLQIITRWQNEILNSFKVQYTNGYTEGVNNKIKVIKQNANRVRNFKRFRACILYMIG